MAKCKILLVSHSGRYCSAGSLLLHAADALRGIGEVHLHFPLEVPSIDIAHKYRTLGIRVLAEPDFDDYDLIIANCQKLAAYINDVLANFGTPISLWFHEGWAHRYPALLRKAVERCCALIFQSPYQCDELYGQLFSEIDVPTYFVPNTAILTENFERGGDDVPPSIVSVGALIPRKRQIDCMRAVAALDREAICYLVGKEGSPELDIYKIASMNRERFIFTGHLEITEAQATIASANIVVHPSGSESQPLVLLEAMSYGRPMIVADIPPYKYMRLVNELNCLIYPLGDVDRLRLALDFLISNPQRARQLGHNAQLLFESDFHPDLFRQRISRTVFEILSQLTPRPS